MARPPKPPLNPVELEAIAGKGNQSAAAIVSAMRGANVGSISQAEATRRRVSYKWIGRQRKTALQDKTHTGQNVGEAGATMPGQNNSPTWATGARLPRSETSEDLRTDQKQEEPIPSAPKVESEQPGATQ